MCLTDSPWEVRLKIYVYVGEDGGGNLAFLISLRKIILVFLTSTIHKSKNKLI